MLGPSGMLAHLTCMAERLEQMKRLLKPSGSIYLHCDATASRYLKVVMDVIFGPVNSTAVLASLSGIRFTCPILAIT